MLNASGWKNFNLPHFSGRFVKIGSTYHNAEQKSHRTHYFKEQSAVTDFFHILTNLQSPPTQLFCPPI